MIIKHLKLYCSNLSELKHYYTKKFHFELVKSDKESITLKTGDSLLTFTENKLQNAYYHFALNIPYGEVNNALRWVKKKVEIVPFKGNDILEFTSWDARSIYFLDPAGNVVEFIGREKIQTEGDVHDNNSFFSEKKVMHISEVGLPVFQVSSVTSMIKKKTQVPEFDCKDNTFCAMGDHRGLFIVVDKAEKTWFPTDEQAKAFPLEVVFVQGTTEFRLKLQAGDQLEIEETQED